MPAISATRIDDGYRLSANGAELGAVFRVDAGWVTVGRQRGPWRRSRPYPTASDAVYARWGKEARDALPSCETSVAA